ncbi:uncharacterized protein SOCE26_079650 [Sorangium cellulosum]|uniref:Uncharacterized protein n=1 Tax=Sorangium cellulosum TaxID=56 RepID=A0A2L0F4U8_SORCE|nr:uncharacterized protein SOCE26_079650 [Sorangium cellulosum]
MALGHNAGARIARAAASEASGPTEVEDEALTAQNRALVLRSIDTVLVGGEHARAGVPRRELRRAPRDESERSSGAHRVRDGGGDRDVKVHDVIADGNFVFIPSGGRREGAATGSMICSVSTAGRSSSIGTRGARCPVRP